MKRLQIILLLISIFTSSISIAQDFHVYDIKTKQAINNVYVYSSKYSGFTNKLGFVHLNNEMNDSVFFQHPDYKRKSVFIDVNAKDYKIYLENEIHTLGEVKVYSTITNSDLISGAIHSMAIKKAEVNIATISNTSDILENTGNIFIQKSQLGGGSPMMRGFSANRILLVYDGVRMNNAIYRSGNLHNLISIDPFSIDNIKIIYGPSSTVFGSDALGGVILINPADLRKIDKNRIGIITKYQTASSEKSVYFNSELNWKRLKVQTSISYSNFGDLIMGNNGSDLLLRNKYVTQINGVDEIVDNPNPKQQINTGYSSYSFINQAIYRLGEHIDLSYNITYSNTNNIPRYDRLIQESDGELKYAEWYYGPQEWLFTNIKLSVYETSAFDKLDFKVSFQDFSESRHSRKYQSDALESRFENVKIFSTGLDFKKQIKRLEFFYGFESNLNKVFSDGIESNISTDIESEISSRYPDNSIQYNIGSYVYVKRKINEKYKLNAGIRLTYNRIYAEMDQSFYSFPYTEINNQAFAPNFSLGIQKNNSNVRNYFVNISSGFRAPNIDDIAKVFDSEPGNIIVPNDKLKPEYLYSVEYGRYFQFNDKLKIDFEIYGSYLDDAIVRTLGTFNGLDSILYDGELSQVQMLDNTDWAYLIGGEIEAHYIITTNLDMSLSYHYIYGKDSENLPLRHISPALGRFKMNYKALKNLSFWFSSNYTGEISFENLALSERSKDYMYLPDENGNPYSPSWITLNSGLSYGYKFAKIDISCTNILDKRYRSYSSGIVAPGRSLNVLLKLLF